MTLTKVQSSLWDRIEKFSLDNVAAAFSFTQRLARENGWQLGYADRVIGEYKKFMFLAVCAGHPVTPSESVDQAWHLHLIYTQSYWTDFCGEILQKPIHHGPTRGGESEKSKFNDWYKQTKQTYRQIFGHDPPCDIWPEAAERFDLKRNRFQRLNINDYWMLKKPDFSKLIRADWIPFVSAGFMPVLFLAWSPYELSGKQFLVFYGGLAIIGFLIAVIVQRIFRMDGSTEWERFEKQVQLNTDEYAFLMGGEYRVLQASTWRLVAGNFV
ncbi:MAG: TIGR04222 domain-containing membrane protein, partial [Planctomycetota bacterium]